MEVGKGFANGFVEKSKEYLNKVATGANMLYEYSKVGLKALADVKDVKSINDFIIIHRLYFQVDLARSIGLCFDITADIQFLRSEKKAITFNACLDGNFITNIGKALIRQLYKGIDKITEGIMKAKHWFEEANTIENEVIELNKKTERMKKEIDEIPDEPHARPILSSSQEPSMPNSRATVT